METKRQIKVFLKPPWEEYPHYKPNELGWRMGGGEYYRIAWAQWLSVVSLEKWKDYLEKFPAPEGWEHYYGGVSRGLSEDEELRVLRNLEEKVNKGEYPFDRHD